MRKRVGRKLLSFIISFCMLLVGLPVFAGGIKELKAADLVDGVLDLSSGTWTDTTIRIPSNISKIVIKGNTGTSYSGLSIEAINGTDPLDVTIQDVNIQGGYIDVARNSSSNTLHIVGSNSVTASGNKSAICVQANKTLTIDAQNSSQSLTAVGGNGAAGIGANDNVNNGTGNIIIKNGKITATGKGGGAGIGQCHQPNGSPSGNISILGGIIEATGSERAAGIGGSNNGPIGNITISGATVTATGGNGGAGIGAGTKKCGDITIDGGAYIKATGNGGGAGIGGGIEGEANVNDILIDGATIEAYGSDIGGAGIGGGNAASFKNLTIQETNPEVPTIIQAAIGGKEAAGIGVGRTSNISDSLITISGGTIVLATGGDQGAGIGGGSQRAANIVITGNAVIEKAQGGSQAAGIGSGPLGSHETITISGGIIRNAIGGEYGSGIGGGDSRSQAVTITAGIVENAQGGTDAAGIGGGRGGKDGCPIKIEGSDGAYVYVHAVGGTPSDSSRGPLNDIGSGRGTTDGEEVNDKVTVKKADVFLGKGVVKGLTTDSTSKPVEFTLYDTWSDDASARVLCGESEVYLRTIENEVSKKLMMDGKYTVEPGAKVHTLIELGSATAEAVDIEQVFHKYWFQYDTAAGIPMVGHPATDYTGWTIDRTPTIQHIDEDTGAVVVDAWTINKIEMDIAFRPGTVNPSGVAISGFDDDISGITPFSTSCITFEVPKITHANYKSLESVKVDMDLSAVGMDFDVSKWQVGVFEKVGNTSVYDYDKNLTQDLKAQVSKSGEKLTLIYPDSILEDGKYKVAVYVNTGYFTSATKPSLAAYKNTYVDAGQKLEIPIQYDINMKVLTIQRVTIPGITDPIEVKNVTVTENSSGNVSLNIPYKEITKIS